MLDAFHVVKLAGNALDEVRRRVQLATLGRRGHKDDPLHRIRRNVVVVAGWQRTAVLTTVSAALPLVTSAPPRDRALEAERARARSAERYART